MNATTFRPAQKAAALVLAMGPQAAAQVFAHLNEKEVEVIAREVAQLGDVQREDLVAVLHEFFEGVAKRRQTVTGDPDHARKLLRAWRGSSGDSVATRVLGEDADRPFGFLQDHDPQAIHEALADEHPQMVAVVLAHLPSKLAARILDGFDPVDQADLSMRIARMDAVPPAVIDKLERNLQDRMGPPGLSALEPAGGTRELASLLNSLPRAKSDAIMDDLAARDPELAERVREQMFVFEDIVTLDDRAIQEVLRTVEPRTLGMAMKGLGTEVTDAIWRNLSERASTALREEMELLGPARKSEVMEARNEVVRNIRRLADEGTIVMAAGGGEELVE